jgi:signal peptidase I
LSEDYLEDEVCTEAGSAIKEGRSIKLSDNQYVLLGDNRYQSLDSRNIGVIDKNRLVGRVVFRFWPMSKIGFLK